MVVLLSVFITFPLCLFRANDFSGADNAKGVCHFDFGCSWGARSVRLFGFGDRWQESAVRETCDGSSTESMSDGSAVDQAIGA